MGDTEVDENDRPFDPPRLDSIEVYSFSFICVCTAVAYEEVELTQVHIS